MTMSTLGSKLTRIVLGYRRALVVASQLSLAALCNYLALLLRFDGEIPIVERLLYYEMLPWLLCIRGVIFVPFRLYEGLWRFTGMWDLRNIAGAIATSTLAFYVLVHWFFGAIMYPRSVFLIDALLLGVSLGAIRLGPRALQEFRRPLREKRVLVYGAGSAGEMIVRDMKRNPASQYEPVGFIDDDPEKHGERIHGVRVLGTRHDLARIVEAEQPRELLVALPRANAALMRSIVSVLEPYKIPITTLPSLDDLANGRVGVGQIRSVSINDLLPRAARGLDLDPVMQLIAGRRVLVTGAGGSIGSELCRQIAALKPSSLMLYERYENGLYAIVNDLQDHHSSVQIHAFIGDVTDVKRLNRVMQDGRPHVVLHAAAHKHVPLMEFNASEAVKNNVIGTLVVAQAAERHGVERFILISTDKAVHPSSVMGATKRVAELVIRAMAPHAATHFAAVRFGNVLGSNGSVVLRFLEQIKAGGPVTVTDPEIRRFFMLIPEAVQLVLQAAALAHDGEMFVLDMGEPIKVLDLARNVIRLSGHVPDEEIPIEFIGLRPGEKLYEELVTGDEKLVPSGVTGIMRVDAPPLENRTELVDQIAELGCLAAEGRSEVVAQLARIVPTFSPGSLPSDPPLREDRRSNTGSRRRTRPLGGRRLTDVLDTYATASGHETESTRVITTA
jgi:FlaA1/EpsC-like NDP-sugar epimerase